MVRGSILPVPVLPLFMLEFFMTLHFSSRIAALLFCTFSLCAAAISRYWMFVIGNETIHTADIIDVIDVIYCYLSLCCSLVTAVGC